MTKHMLSALVSFFFLVLFRGLGHEGLMPSWIADILVGVSAGWFIMSIVRDVMVEAASIIGGSIKVEVSVKKEKPSVFDMKEASALLDKIRSLRKNLPVREDCEEPMKKHKFKVGDLVIGNEQAGKRYSITGKGIIVMVEGYYVPEDSRIRHGSDIVVRKVLGSTPFFVREDCFDPWTPERELELTEP